MRCEHLRSVFPLPNNRALFPTPRLVRCRRKARVIAGVPYGVNVVDYCYCRECAGNRVRDVLAGRGKVVTVEEMPATVGGA